MKWDDEEFWSEEDWRRGVLFDRVFCVTVGGILLVAFLFLLRSC